MKKFIQWLAKVFKAQITKTEIKTVEKIVEKQIALGGTIEGDLTVKGNLLAEGWLNVLGGCACLGVCKKEKKEE